MSEELKPTITNDPVPIRNNLVVERVICPSCGVGEMLWSVQEEDKTGTYFIHICINCGHEEKYSKGYPRVGFITKSGEFQEVQP